jgi:hypothetical protein
MSLGSPWINIKKLIIIWISGQMRVARLLASGQVAGRVALGFA